MAAVVHTQANIPGSAAHTAGQACPEPWTAEGYKALFTSRLAAPSRGEASAPDWDAAGVAAAALAAGGRWGAARALAAVAPLIDGLQVQ